MGRGRYGKSVLSVKDRAGGSVWLAWAQAFLTPGLPSPDSHHLGTPAKEALAYYGMSLERGAGHLIGEISSVSQDDLGHLLPPN